MIWANTLSASLLLFWKADLLPVLLVPGAEALAAKHEIFILDGYRFHPPVRLRSSFRDHVVGRRVLLGVVGIRRGGHHFER